MLTKRTVFVLGAGASVMFGFPIGQTLCRQVIERFAHPAYIEGFIEYTNIAKQAVIDFRRELLLSAQPSVDLFLEYRPEFLEVGKAALAMLLVQHEADDRLWSFDDANWMRYLFDRMRAPFDKFGQNPVSFLTFNYDRSLEHFLCTSLQALFGKSESACAEVLRGIPIIHLHGRLGYLPWEGKDKTRSRQYNHEMNRVDMEICCREIKVVHEDISDGRDEDFRAARKLLEGADQIYFLGFGYGSINMDRLGIVTLAQTIGAKGTGYGLTPKECGEIIRRSAGRITPQQGLDCIALFRNQVEWQ